MTPEGLPPYRVETFDYFGRRVELCRNLNREEALAIARAWLAASPHHTVKVTAGAHGAPVML